MTSRTRLRAAASIATAALVLTGGLAVAPAASAAPSVPQGTDLDYFAAAYDSLEEGSVFTPVTFERFERLLNSEGTYAFLVGGPADLGTQATVAHIDAVAKEYGVEAVYAFDPRLDGADVDIRTSGLEDVAALWTRLVETSLGHDAETPFGGDVSDDPYLFVYDGSGGENRIVSALTGPVDVEALGDGAGYRAQVAAVFDAIAVDGKAEVDTQSSFAFFRDAVNQKHAAQYTDADKYGGEILTDADAEGFVLRQLSYPELLQVLETDGDHVILFGGTWCHNTRAVIGEVNRVAAAAGVDTVYVFDLRLDGASSNDLHIRDSNSALSYLYGDLVAQHLPNLRTQYVASPEGSAGQRVDYLPGGDPEAGVAIAPKLQVPYLIEYDRSDAAAPIVQDWIQELGDGAFKEYMTEYWWVNDLPGNRNANRYPATPEGDAAWAAEQEKQWAFADEAIEKIHVFFGQDGSSEQPGTGEGEGETPGEGEGPGDGEGETPGETGGEGEETPAAPTASVTGDLRPGGAIVVTGQGLPASAGLRVEIRSTPQSLGAVTTTADGAFRLETTIPASVPAGAHTIVVLQGDQVLASAAVTVAPAPAAAGLAVTGDALPAIAAGAALLLLLAGAALLLRRRAHRG